MPAACAAEWSTSSIISLLGPNNSHSCEQHKPVPAHYQNHFLLPEGAVHEINNTSQKLPNNHSQTSEHRYAFTNSTASLMHCLLWVRLQLAKTQEKLRFLSTLLIHSCPRPKSWFIAISIASNKHALRPTNNFLLVGHDWTLNLDGALIRFTFAFLFTIIIISSWACHLLTSNKFDMFE